MRLFLLLTTSAFALCLAQAVSAADLVVGSKIDSVAVYPDGAMVTRSAAIDLPPGETKLVFKSLPLDLDPDSLRVSAEASEKLSIGSLETHTAVAQAPPASDLDDRIKGLRAERETIQVTLDALLARKAMILRYSAADPGKIVLDGKPMDVSQWHNAWDLVTTALETVAKDLRTATDKANALDADIAALETQKQHPAARLGPARDVSVAFEANAAVKGKVTLTYRVASANWRPAYDARLDTGTATTPASLDLVRRATVRQHTGEAWDGVTLTLSTLATHRGTAAADLASWQVGFVPDQEADDAAIGGGLMRRHMAMRPRLGAAPAMALPAPPPMAMKAAEEPEAVVVTSAYAATFTVPGIVSVSNDGAERSFRLASRTLTPTIALKAIPAVETTAYLTASLSNTGEAPLLPGPVSLVRDNTFIGTGQIKLVPPGDTFDLGFGADESVTVTRVPVVRKENDPIWAGSLKFAAQEFKTSVKNLHDFPIKISIVDRVPVSEVTTLIVEQLPATTPPTEKIVGDKRGVMAWTYTLKPNEAKDIHLAYRMKWPSDHELSFHE